MLFDERAEVGSVHDDDLAVADRANGRVARRQREDPDLPETVARPVLLELPPAPAHLETSGPHHVEGIGRIALADDDPVRGDRLDARPRADPLDDVVRKARERRAALQERVEVEPLQLRARGGREGGASRLEQAEVRARHRQRLDDRTRADRRGSRAALADERELPERLARAEQRNGRLLADEVAPHDLGDPHGDEEALVALVALADDRLPVLEPPRLEPSGDLNELRFGRSTEER